MKQQKKKNYTSTACNQARFVRRMSVLLVDIACSGSKNGATELREMLREVVGASLEKNCLGLMIRR